MSTGSFDESSNLVVEVPSPTNGEKDEVHDKKTPGSGASSASSTPKKSSKGFGFLSRSKESKGASKGTSKGAPKLAKRSKSPCKSPSRENLTENIGESFEEKGEESSAEWQAFQKMQERIKETVAKTQSSLHKLNKTNSGRDLIGESTHLDVAGGSWINFNDSELLSDECLDSLDDEAKSSSNIDISWASFEDNVSSSLAVEKGKELPHLTVTPVPSPRLSPKPPSNSLRSSLEDLSVNPLSKEPSPDKNQDVADLLGLINGIDNASYTDGKDMESSNVLNEDLLELDNFMSTSHQAQTITQHGLQTSEWLLNAAPSDSNRSSQQSTPTMFDQDFLGFDNKEMCSSSTMLTNNLVDSFLGLDVSNSSSMSSSVHHQVNPFEDLTEEQASTIPVSNKNPFDFTTGNETVALSSQPLTQPVSVSAIHAQTSEDNPFKQEKPATNMKPDLSSSDIFPQPINTKDVTNEENKSLEEKALFVPAQEVATNPFLFNERDSSFLSTDLFEDDFFASKTTEVSGTENVWGGSAAEDGAMNNPFQDDCFNISEIPDNILEELDGKTGQINGVMNPFLETEPVASVSAINPFLSQSEPGNNQGNMQINNVDVFLDKGSKLVAPESTADIFDPFGIQSLENEFPETDVFATATAGSSDDELKLSPGDERETFMLEIKPREHIETIPPCALPPPPKVPKSPQMPPRVNPFDRDSPPEENFAKFEINETELKSRSERSEMVLSVSTESSTPEEEEIDLEPLEDFQMKFEGEGWKMMLRQPTKKKLTGNRYWKNVFVKLVVQNDGPVLKFFNNDDDKESFQELPLQPCYSMSELSLQQYDQYGKIHTVKIQYIFYRERVGIRPERIASNFVKRPKPTMMLDHSPQISELLKLGSLDCELMKTFIREVENAFMKMEAHREKTLSYTKDEIIVHVLDEYKATVNVMGHIEKQKARIRLFCLAFLTGMPTCELGINDRRRKGKEVVGRYDIIPIKTEDWIRPEEIEFHCSVDKEEYKKIGIIKFHPLDACQFELMRYRVRMCHNKELPLQAKIQQIIKGMHVEIRCDLLVTGYHANSKKHGQYPCEDIQIRFPIPEPWIYLFRYERRFGYGSFKSATRKPGKIKGLERITMIAQGVLSPALMEASVGSAKYENVYRAVVWKISRLPERNQGAYTNHLFTLRLDLGPHDEKPEKYEKYADIEFTMPASTVTKSQVRSISIANPNIPEKWVNYTARYDIQVEIEHIQCAEEETEET